ncbi:hypothetical protein CLAIMM_00678 isoform 2 [Cladophialophora immunda]|nr:hypothetical protein CLAIMM_00678 isoform 1 [Cladophialophora immunda]OQU94312.1 hypothetical protein CLAIMM_00678 isoform 2 [Cladophialophora immunda]
MHTPAPRRLFPGQQRGRNPLLIRSGQPPLTSYIRGWFVQRQLHLKVESELISPFLLFRCPKLCTSLFTRMAASSALALCQTGELDIVTPNHSQNGKGIRVAT